MRILALDFAEDAAAAAPLAAQGEILFATCQEQADQLVTGDGVDAIVVDANQTAPWVNAWLRTLSPERRPALVMTGTSADRTIAEADEWITDHADAAEVATRLRVAMKRSRLRRRAVRRGNVDPLTGLANRRGVILALLRAAARQRRQGTRLSLVLIDLDEFKRVNEQQGHDAGDRVLRKVGRVLRGATRQDEVCGRIGGDEFVVVVAGDAQHGELVGSRVAAGLRAEGVAATWASSELAPAESLRDLYRRVDVQLRARKRQKRGN